MENGSLPPTSKNAPESPTTVPMKTASVESAKGGAVRKDLGPDVCPRCEKKVYLAEKVSFFECLCAFLCVYIYTYTCV